MASVYELFETSTQKETAGVLVQYANFRCRVKRAGGANKAFLRAYREKTRHVKRALATDKLDDDTADEIAREIYAETVIADPQTLVDGSWVDGVPGRAAGEVLPPTEDSLKAFLRTLPSLMTNIMQDAQDEALYLAQEREEEAGNS